MEGAHEDDARRAEDSEPVAEAAQEAPERPTERMEAEAPAAAAPAPEPEPAPAPVEESPVQEHHPEPEAEAPAPQPEAEQKPEQISMTPPEPEEAEPVVVRAEAAEDDDADEPDTGTLKKDELRRAVAGTAKKTPDEAWSGDADDGRVSAEALIAPTMRKRHPYAPEPVAEPDTERRMKVYAFANQKGGVAKTTTTLNLAVALSESGHKVLCLSLIHI